VNLKSELGFCKWKEKCPAPLKLAGAEIDVHFCGGSWPGQPPTVATALHGCWPLITANDELRISPGWWICAHQLSTFLHQEKCSFAWKKINRELIELDQADV
jgi:hypothetical protein